ncbi:EKC/KEOPS complex subunit TP53RK-like, partial [Ctenocephalides felis]|uniref:EKC/KEOPS complex subunit TP53RK-like n=1 Tax=Ctenocephalides felis TaxID=7515 RepID=UPI000E6E4E4E
DSFKLIKQGAEGRIYHGIYLGKHVLVKERFKKSYRHPDLDDILTKERMKSEAKLIVRSKSAGIRTPAIYMVDFERRIIIMQYFEKNITLKEYISKYCKDNAQELQALGNQIGALVAKLHIANIIHGDLTSSNILLVPSNPELKDWSDNISLKNSNLILIDFGLSHIDTSSEDKGVDLYVLERALLSTHSDVGEILRNNILQSYRKSSNKAAAASVLEKYEEVRARGRKRTMVG